MLSECQTAWIGERRRFTRRLIQIQAVCIWYFSCAWRAKGQHKIQRSKLEIKFHHIADVGAKRVCLSRKWEHWHRGYRNLSGCRMVLCPRTNLPDNPRSAKYVIATAKLHWNPLNTYSYAHYQLEFNSGSGAVPVNWNVIVSSSSFAIFKNVVHSLEPDETPSNSASHQVPNYAQHS